MKNLCLIFAISILPNLGFSQLIGDTVLVYIDNRVEIKVAISDYDQLSSSEKVTAILDEFKEMLPMMHDQLLPEKADLVKFAEGKAPTIEPGDPKIIYLQKEGEISNTGFRDVAILSGEDFKIFITTTDLSKISDMSLSACFKKAVAQLPEKKHWSKSLSYECIDGNVTLIEDKINHLDMLELGFAAGAGLVRTTWVPDLSIRASLLLNQKGVSYGPYVSSNLLFDFTQESKVNLNTFLNLGYEWTINKHSEKRDMMGFELGYLISKKGDMFGENTFKIGFNWRPTTLVSVNPHIYVTDNFGQVFPGIRIGFGF